MQFSKFQTVIMAGLAIRLVMAPFVAHPFDVYAWYVNGESLLNGTRSIWSFLAPYSYALLLFVFPAAIAFRSLSGVLGIYSIQMSSLDPRLNPGALWNITVVPGLLYDLLVKLPLIASDTLIAILLYQLVKRQRGDEKLATSVSLMWFLNPLTIWVSSGWGMFDTLPALFTVLALYFIFSRKFAYSGVSLAVAVAMKYYAVVLLLPLLFLAWKRGGKRGSTESLGGTALTSLLFFAPLIDETTSGFVSLASGSTASGLHYSGLSFWTAITLFFSGVPQTVISGAIIIALLAVSYAWIWKRCSKVDLRTASAYFGLPILVLLLAFRFVGENYFVWVLPFASVLALGGKRASLLLWLMSGVALVSSLTDALLPYYLLPIAPWIGGYLVSALQAVAPYRVAQGGSVTEVLSLGKVILSGLGISATAILALTGREWIRHLRSSQSP